MSTIGASTVGVSEIRTMRPAIHEPRIEERREKQFAPPDVQGGLVLGGFGLVAGGAAGLAMYSADMTAWDIPRGIRPAVTMMAGGAALLGVIGGLVGLGVGAPSLSSQSQ